MEKKDKIRLLINFTSASGDIEETFRKKVYSFPLNGDPIEVDALRRGVLERFRERQEQYMEEQADVYAAYLSEATLDASIAFYLTEAGQEVISCMPLINDRLAKAGSSFSRDMMIELSKLLESFPLDGEDEDDVEDEDPYWREE